MDPTIELMRLGQFSSQVPDSSPDSPNNNAYGSSPDSAPDAQQPAPSGDPVSGFVNGFLNSFTPQTQARDNLASMMNNMPTYQPPGLFGKIEAGLIGATRGPQAAQQYLHQPYNDAMTGWQNQVRVGQQLASDESQANNTGRAIAIAQQNTTDKEQKMQNDLGIAQGKLGVAQDRAQVYQQNANTSAARAATYAEMARGGVPEWDNNGNLYILHKDGNMEPVTAPDGSPATIKMFSPEELQEMKDNAAMSRTLATQKGETDRVENKPGPQGQVFQQPDGTFVRVNPDNTTTPIGGLKPGAAKPATVAKPTEPTVQEQDTTRPSAWYERWFEGAGPTVTTKSTVTTKTPEAVQNAQQSNNKVPLATDIPLEKRTDGMAAMVGGQLMHWSKASGGWVK